MRSSVGIWLILEKLFRQLKAFNMSTFNSFVVFEITRKFSDGATKSEFTKKITMCSISETERTACDDLRPFFISKLCDPDLIYGDTDAYDNVMILFQSGTKWDPAGHQRCKRRFFPAQLADCPSEL